MIVPSVSKSIVLAPKVGWFFNGFHVPGMTVISFQIFLHKMEGCGSN
jgi:hypothetical protein